MNRRAIRLQALTRIVREQIRYRREINTNEQAIKRTEDARNRKLETDK